MAALAGASMRDVLEDELETWARRWTVAMGEVEELGKLPSDNAVAHGIDGAHAWLEVCESKHTAIKHELVEWIRQHG